MLKTLLFLIGIWPEPLILTEVTDGSLPVNLGARLRALIDGGGKERDFDYKRVARGGSGLVRTAVSGGAVREGDMCRRTCWI